MPAGTYTVKDGAVAPTPYMLAQWAHTRACCSERIVPSQGGIGKPTASPDVTI